MAAPTDTRPLLPMQDADAAFLVAGRHRALFSEPGTGKTFTALEALRQSGLWPAVVVGPPIALGMWAHAAQARLGVRAFAAGAGTRPEDVPASTDLLVTTWTMAQRHADRVRAARALILDEADALKNAESDRTVAFFGRRLHLRDCLAENAEQVWCLTGTPVRRYADDLWPWLRALHGQVTATVGKARTLAEFQTRYCVLASRQYHPRQPPRWVTVGNRNMEALHALIYGQRLAVRRRLQDVAPLLPPVTLREVTVEHQHSRDLAEATKAAHGVDPDHPLMATARRHLGVAKARSVAAHVLRVIEDDRPGPVMVLYWHREVGDALRAEFDAHGLPSVTIDGRTRLPDRQRIEAEFNARRHPILLGQIGAMGVSINLQEGSHRAIFAEVDWSPAAQEQALRRVWRLGQRHRVQVDVCLADHSVDDAARWVLRQKAEGADMIVDGGTRT